MNIDAYLKRIGIAEKKKPDLDFLAELQNRHLLSISFENLDIVPLRRPFGIDVKKFFKKIVIDNRGGFCYENNAIFGAALESLGYNVTYLSAGVMNDKGEFGPEFDHMTLFVQLDDNYLVDVGFGDSSRVPLPMNGEQQTDVSGTYRINSNADGVFHLEKDENEAWKPQYRFTLKPRTLSEYESMCRYHQTSPDSPFTSKSLCTIATVDGRVRVSGMNFAITCGSEKTERILSSENEWKEVLKSQFGVVIS